MKRPSAEIFCLPEKAVTFTGSFKLPVILIRLLLSGCPIINVVKMDWT